MYRLAIIISLIAVCAVQQAAAQYSWKRLPMYGTNIYELAVDDEGSVWAATSSGLYRSDNNGATWKKQFKSNNGLDVFGDVGATHDRSGKRYMMAATTFGDYYRSADRGETWEEVLEEADYLAAGEVKTLVTAAGSRLISVYEAGIRRLPEGTETSASVLYTPHNTPVELVQTTTGTIYTSGEDGGVYVSTDDGQTWSDFFIDAVETTASRRLLLHGGEFVYIVRDGVYRSQNEGADWNFTATDVDLEAGAAVLLANGDVVTPGYRNDVNVIIRITANGETTVSTEGFFHVPVSTLALAGDGSVLMGSRGALNRSTDNGASWSTSQEGIPAGLRTVAYRPGSPTVYLSDFYSIYSYDGTELRPLASALPRKQISMYDVAVAHNGSVVIAAAEDGVFTSNSEVSSFEQHLQGIFVGTVYTRPSGALLATYNNQGLLESTDNGATWEARIGIPDSDFFPSLDFLAETSAGYIFTGSLLTGTLLRIDPDHKKASIVGSNMRSITVAPNNDVYVVLFDGHVLRSSDNGATWTDISQSALAGTYALRIAVGASGTVYCAARTGLFRSFDRGTTWESAGWDGEFLTHVEIDNMERLYVGVRDSGVYVADASVVHVAERAGTTALHIAPNPAAEKAVLTMQLQQPAAVRIALHDATGRLAATILDEYRREGSHTIGIDLAGIAAGNYRVVVQTGGTTSSHSLIVVR